MPSASGVAGHLSRRQLMGTALSPLLLVTKAAQRPPNILLVCSDDQAWWSVGAQGNRQARTPNIDKLQKDGAHLKNCFVTTPVCSPSRATLLTSRYATETGITQHLGYGGEDLKRGLEPRFVTWPEVLSQKGYRTGLIGKWHLGARPPFHPTNHGFQHFVGWFITGNEGPGNPELEVDGKVKQFQGTTIDIITDFGLDFIRKRRKEPFLLCMNYREPHASNAPDAPRGERTWLPMAEQDWAHFRNLDPDIPNPNYPNLDVRRVKHLMREYLASVASVDRSLGRVLSLLSELDLASNTIVIFTSDNGYNMGHNGIWHKGNGWWILTNNRGARHNLYDNSIRVPAALRWPGVIQCGTVINETITNLDWYPTILAAAGIDVPKGVTVHGHNFVPLLKGKRIAWNNDMFAQYNMHPDGLLRTYRTPEWKLVRDFYRTGNDELYDLANDPAESKNLISLPDPVAQKVKRTLESRLLAKMREIHDPVLNGASVDR